MLTSQRGMAFILVLVFFVVFSLLGLCALQSNALQLRLAKNAWDKDNLLAEAQSALSQSEAEFNYRVPACMIVLTSTVTLTQQPLSWWQSQACTGHLPLLQYYYVIEAMGNDPCTQIGQMDYYRLTLLLTTGVQREILQSYIAVPNKTRKVCVGGRHNIQPGQQSWHILV